MVGPNGSGKSSVFDAFLLKSNSGRSNWALTDGTYGGYLLKDEAVGARPGSTHEVAESVNIELDTDISEWSKAFNIRSPIAMKQISRTLASHLSSLTTKLQGSNASLTKTWPYQITSVDWDVLRCTVRSEGNLAASHYSNSAKIHLGN